MSGGGCAGLSLVLGTLALFLSVILSAGWLFIGGLLLLLVAVIAFIAANM